jgi:hypothetical protein
MSLSSPPNDLNLNVGTFLGAFAFRANFGGQLQTWTDEARVEGRSRQKKAASV